MPKSSVNRVYKQYLFGAVSRVRYERSRRHMCPPQIQPSCQPERRWVHHTRSLCPVRAITSSDSTWFVSGEEAGVGKKVTKQLNVN